MTSTAEYHPQEAETAALLRANTHLQREVDKRQRIEHMLVRRNRQMLADLRLAAEFQRSLLPELPALPHLDMAVRYRPYAQVSGDVYDFALNREGAVGVLVGDATGHGLTAAFMTMLAQSSLDSIRGDLPTDTTLSRLNALLCERLTGRAMTAVFFRISRCGALSVSHAGHPSLVVLPASGAAPVSFRNGGCALGAFDDEPVPYVEEQYRLAPGDTVFACTDGLLEWRDSAGAPFGEKRLLETLARHARQAPDALLDATLADLRRYGHGGRGDDVTLLACRFRATA